MGSFRNLDEMTESKKRSKNKFEKKYPLSFFLLAWQSSLKSYATISLSRCVGGSDDWSVMQVFSELEMSRNGRRA